MRIILVKILGTGTKTKQNTPHCHLLEEWNPESFFNDIT